MTLSLSNPEAQRATSWDEPLVIASRLAAALDAPLHRWSENDGAAVGCVLLVASEQLDDVPAERLSGAAATVVAGTPADATSAGVRTLAERAAERGLVLAASSFATRTDADGAVHELPLVVAAPPGDERAAELLAAGPHALALDSAVDVATVTADDPPARVCVVSFEASGMTGGGIGTASTSLAESLARAGHDVTLLFTGWQDRARGERNERWQRAYAERGVKLEILRVPASATVGNKHFPARTAYEVYCWLRRNEHFDVVHVPENMGNGAYALLAKRQRRAFERTTFVVGTHGPTRWAAEANRTALTFEEMHVSDALERMSVELTDVLLGPSRYLHDYMRERGWTLPARVHVQPLALPAAVRERRAETAIPSSVRARVAADAPAPADGRQGLPDEIVFFGRLETRKGVATLCDALDLLSESDDLPRFSVTFLGPIWEVFGQPADDYVEARAARWPWRWQIVSDRDQEGAADYLRRPGVLAVMPSTVDNAPNTVSEAVALGIPLVAGRTGGTGELVAAEQRDDHMFGAPNGGALLPPPLTATPRPTDAAPLAQLLRHRLTTPVAPARPAAPSESVDDVYDRWHRAARRAAERAADVAQPPLPALSVCLLFDGDEELLGAQLDAFAETAAELVVADLRADGTEPIALANERAVTVVRPDRTSHGAETRDAAVAATRGELIAFVPPVDVPLAPFADALRTAAAATGADVYGCVALDERPPEERDDEDDERDEQAAVALPDDPAVHAFVPLFGPPLAGLSHPAFSAGAYAIRRSALARLGGFAPDARGDEADHELLNRAAASGLRVEVVPEPLTAKRRADRWSPVRAEYSRPAEPPYDADQWLRAERPLTQQGPGVETLASLLRGLHGEIERLHGVVAEQRKAHTSYSAAQRAWIDDLEDKATEFRTYQAELEAENQRLAIEAHQMKHEAERVRAINEEMSQSAKQLAVRTVREVGRRAAKRIRS